MTDTQHQEYLYNKNLQDSKLESDKAMYAPTLREQMANSQAVIITETDPKKVLKDIEFALRNIELDVETNDIKKLGYPLMNDKGINKMKTIARSVVNQNTILSRIDDMREVNRLTLFLADNIIDDIALNWKEYGVKNLSDLDIIADSVIFPIHMCLKRAIEESEKRFLGRISFESINRGGGSEAVKKPTKKWSDFLKL